MVYANRRMTQLTTTMYREGIATAQIGLVYCLDHQLLNSGRLASSGVSRGYLRRPLIPPEESSSPKNAQTRNDVIRIAQPTKTRESNHQPFHFHHEEAGQPKSDLISTCVLRPFQRSPFHLLSLPYLLLQLLFTLSTWNIYCLSPFTQASPSQLDPIHHQ